MDNENNERDNNIENQTRSNETNQSTRRGFLKGLIGLGAAVAGVGAARNLAPAEQTPNNLIPIPTPHAEALPTNEPLPTLMPTPPEVPTPMPTPLSTHEALATPLPTTNPLVHFTKQVSYSSVAVNVPLYYELSSIITLSLILGIFGTVICKKINFYSLFTF